MYANVIVEIGVKNVDKMFSYIIPDNLKRDVKIGSRVIVEFGKQLLEGFVLDITKEVNTKFELKYIKEVVDKEPILNKEMLKLGDYISKHTLCSKISAYQAMLPKAYKASYKTNINKKMIKYITLNKDKEEITQYIKTCRYPKQKELLIHLLNNKEKIITNIDSTIKTLLKHNYIKLIEKEKYRYEIDNKLEDKRVELNEEQQNVINKVIKNINSNKTFLLYGITGSGKTEVYMNIIEYVISKGKNAIMLVPEISLTPQIVARFISRFGNNIAIMHSGLSDGEKYDEYRKILNKEVKIVVGARSAIFVPFDNIGAIIMDEEHSSTYKQDNHPRYHARDIAIWRSNYHNCPVILGSATPSLESMARAGNKVYNLLTLTKRAGSGLLPKVHLVDMKEEIKKGNYIISSIMDNKIKERIKLGQQVILLLNRRGYSSIETCNNCGNVTKCPNCDITLTYHKNSNMLRCHYCGYAIKKNINCPKCGSSDLKDYGLGTEKLEEELNKKYHAKIIRMDIDTTSRKGKHEKIIEDFGNHKYDILLGTQMIAKGLDFPLVTLVGVINADASLNIPDFRSSERTFQLLSQVAGRAGRSNLKGEVIIQTYNNNHYSIVMASHHNYLAFYQEEMKIRKQLNYSPYYYIILVTIITKDYELSFKEASKVGEYLRNNLSSNTYVLGPAMANIFKMNNTYRQNCIIKYRKDPNLNKILLDLDTHYKSNSKVNIEIDISPNHL
ncbi:MAG: primosomal protein N' [Bacilli bacterium]|nr:primosomal protein N' [Bacilli bacterium]